MRLRLPKEKGKNAFLSCVRYPDCRGARWFDDKGALEEPRPAPETGPPCALCKTPMLKRGPTIRGQLLLVLPTLAQRRLGLQLQARLDQRARRLSSRPRAARQNKC